jgi:outer membrane protein OmpA-like peptidoglycan-associated protein
MVFDNGGANGIINPDSAAISSVKAIAEVPEDFVVYFAFDKSNFEVDAVLDTFCRMSDTYLNENSQAQISIIGHTDRVGTLEYNMRLGYRRAQGVQQYLTNCGIPEARMVIESMGESNPAESNNSSKGRGKNRRTEITIKK